MSYLNSPVFLSGEAKPAPSRVSADVHGRRHRIEAGEARERRCSRRCSALRRRTVRGESEPATIADEPIVTPASYFSKLGALSLSASLSVEELARGEIVLDRLSRFLDRIDLHVADREVVAVGRRGVAVARDRADRAARPSRARSACPSGARAACVSSGLGVARVTACVVLPGRSGAPVAWIGERGQQIGQDGFLRQHRRRAVAPGQVERDADREEQDVDRGVAVQVPRARARRNVRRRAVRTAMCPRRRRRSPAEKSNSNENGEMMMRTSKPR